MVFSPTHKGPIEPHEPAAAPRRAEHVAPPSDARQQRHQLWRAVVHALDRDTVQTTWHLAGCVAPQTADAHCLEGQRLLQAMGDPDGHCLIEGHCGRCDQA